MEVSRGQLGPPSTVLQLFLRNSLGRDTLKDYSLGVSLSSGGGEKNFTEPVEKEVSPGAKTRALTSPEKEVGESMMTSPGFLLVFIMALMPSLSDSQHRAR